MHIMRNTVDHGIETPEERKTVGKPQDGHRPTLRTSLG